MASAKSMYIPHFILNGILLNDTKRIEKLVIGGCSFTFTSWHGKNMEKKYFYKFL